MPRIPRAILTESFQAMKAARDPIIGGGAGTGLPARCEAAGGIDLIVCHLGLTTGGAIGAETARKLEDCPALVNDWAEAALRVNPDVIVLAHGGPVSMPDDAEYVLQNTDNCHGFYGASSMERLPTEIALTEQTRSFKSIRFAE